MKKPILWLFGFLFQLFSFAMCVIAYGHVRLFPFFHFDLAGERNRGDAFVQDRLALSDYIGHLIVVQIGDAGIALEIIDKVLSGLDGTSEIQRSVGGLEGPVVDAAFAFNTDAEREAACVWGVPFPSVVGEIAEITA